MSKVVLTKEQAEAIETLKKEKSFREIIWLNLNANTWGGTYVEKPKRIIVKMNFDDLIKALYIGYEVEPEFKAGDWVVNTSSGYIKLIENEREANFLNNDYIKYHELRHATAEEIATEKERRWWEKNGREVWELKEGDILISKKTDKVYEVGLVSDNVTQLNVSFYHINDVKQDFKVACFAEQRLDKEVSQ